MDIRCRKTRCVYNDRFTCKAKGIMVNNRILCSTFEKSEGKAEVDSTKHLFEEPPQYAQQRDSKTCHIGCSAKCQFNHDGKCVSNGITVNAIKEKPYCISFLER